MSGIENYCLNIFQEIKHQYESTSYQNNTEAA